MKRNYIILLILFFASLFNLTAREVIMCQKTNGCIDKNGDYLCCSIIKNTTCDDLILYDAAGNPWPRGSYECIDIEGAVIIKPLVHLNSDVIWDPNKMQVKLDPKDPTIPETVLADLKGIWNNEEGSLQVLQVYANDDKETVTVRVFTPFLKSPYLPDKVYKVMIPFATETSKVFEIKVNIKELEQEQVEYVVSPNPFNETLHVEIKQACSDCEEHKYKLILTTDGIHEELIQDITTGTNNINTSAVHPGSYYFLIKNLSGALVKSGQIIKQ